MSLNLNALTVYNDELSFGLAKKAVLGFNTRKFIRTETGVHGNMRLNTLDSNLIGSNASCYATSTGTTTLAGNVLTTCQVTFIEDICLDDLRNVWYGNFMSKTALGEDLGQFENFFLEERVGKLGEIIEQIAWRGNYTTGATGNLLLCDGFLQNALELSATTVNVTKTAMTTSNAIAIVDAYYLAAPEAIKDAEDLRLFLSPADFRTYILALRDAKYFQPTVDFKSTEEINHPGSNLIVTKANGMLNVGSGTAILSRGSNMVFGTLADSDNTSIEAGYNFHNRLYRFVASTKIGFQFIIAEQVVRAA